MSSAGWLLNPPFGCRDGVILYRTVLPASLTQASGLLDLGRGLHDYAQACPAVLQVFNAARAGPAEAHSATFQGTTTCVQWQLKVPALLGLIA